jgi:hypothetical protein
MNKFYQARKFSTSSYAAAEGILFSRRISQIYFLGIEKIPNFSLENFLVSVQHTANGIFKTLV